MAEPTSKFQPETLDFIARNARAVDRIAKILGVPPELLIGAVANEHDTRFNPDLFWKGTGPIVQKLGDVAATVDLLNREPIDHEDIDQNYHALRKGERNSFGKLGNPATVDVGPGNIRISTAIDLLHEYAEQHPVHEDDPLELKKYLGHYDALRDDLLKFDKPETTLALAGLMTRKAAPFFESIDSAAWRRLAPEQQHALGVMYYKMGPQTLEKNINERRRKLNGAVFSFNPHGDGGEQHLNNLRGINNALRIGRIQGENVVPHVPEDELVNMRSVNGPVIPRSAWQGPRRTNPEFTYDGRAAVLKMRGELDGYRGFDTPRERRALEREAPPSSLGSVHDKRDAQQWPTKWAPPFSGLARYWQNKEPDRDSLRNVVLSWFE
jgi:hypothetical protein